MKNYQLTTQETLERLHATPEGLSSQEAARRLSEHGANRLAEGKKQSLLHRFLEQLADPMMIVLLVAAVLWRIAGGCVHYPVCGDAQCCAGRFAGEQGGKGH